MTPEAEEFTERLDRVVIRLTAQALDGPRPGQTKADPSTGESWESGDIWAHLAEFISYWIPEAEQVIRDYGDEPVAFGRTKRDPKRIAAITNGRTEQISSQCAALIADAFTLRNFIAGVAPEAWAARGVHPTLGVMPLTQIVDEFLVGHLEEHADQLDELAS